MILALAAHKDLCRSGSQARKAFFLFSRRNKKKTPSHLTQLPRPLCQGEKETLAVYWSLQASLGDKKEAEDEV